MVESVRVGTVIAQDRKAANRWKAMRGRRAVASGDQKALSGAALERAIGAFAVAHPEYVIVEAA